MYFNSIGSAPILSFLSKFNCFEMNAKKIIKKISIAISTAFTKMGIKWDCFNSITYSGNLKAVEILSSYFLLLY